MSIGRAHAGLGGVVVLHRDSHLGQLDHLVVGEAVPLLEEVVHLDVLGCVVMAVVGVDHLDLLRTELAAKDRLLALPERRLEDVELVGVDGSLHDVFAQPVGPGDEDHIAETGLGVEGEEHPALGQIRPDHLHDGHRLGHLELPEAVLEPVVDAAVGEHAREAALDRLDQLGLAVDVEERLVGTREARFGEILGCR